LSFGGFQNGANDVPTTVLPAAYGQQITVTVTATNSGGSTQFPFIIPTYGTVGNANYPETFSLYPTTFSSADGATVAITGMPNSTVSYGVGASVNYNSGTLTIDGTGGGGPTTWTNTGAFKSAAAGANNLYVKFNITGKTFAQAVTITDPNAPAIIFNQNQTIDIAYSYSVSFSVTIRGYPSGVVLDYGQYGLDFADSNGRDIAGIDSHQLQSLQNGTYTIKARTNGAPGYGNFTMHIGSSPLYLTITYTNYYSGC
jgi:hypothetical protein